MLKCDKEVEALVEKHLAAHKNDTVEKILVTGMGRRKTLKTFAKKHPYVPVAERKATKKAKKAAKKPVEEKKAAA